MPFSALVNLGTIGSGISGQNVSISGCTGASCGSVCTPLVSAQAVSSFPKQISISDDNVVSLFVRVDGGSCAGTTQCITITTGTPSPTPTATSVGPTPTATPVQPTATPTPTPTSTGVPPTPTPTSTLPNCVHGVGFEVDVAGQVRYVTCGGTTQYVNLGIGPQYISECIQNNSLFGVGATISQISYGSPCVAPTPTPTLTATPAPTTPPLYGFFNSNPSATYNGHCNANQITSAQFYSSSSTIPNMLNTTVYGDTNYTPWIGGNSYYAVSSDNTFNTNNPPYYVIRVDNNGFVDDVQYISSCTGGGAQN